MEELVSYRAQSFEMNGTIAAFTEQHKAQATRSVTLLLSTIYLFGILVNQINIAGQIASTNRLAAWSSEACPKRLQFKICIVNLHSLGVNG